MAFIDARSLPDGSAIEADLVIIGGGMAGIAIAREWAGADLTVAVLESGGRDADPEIQDLYTGSAAIRAPGYDERRIDRYLAVSRRRALGGSGAIWGAKCVPLDEADFEERSWLQRTGWPMTRASLDPFYDRACALLEIAPFRRDYDSEPEPGRPPLRIGGGRDFFSAPRRFSRISGGNPEAFDRYRTDFAAAANIDVYLHANVVEIGVARHGRAATRLDVACLNGRRHTAEGRAYVLATGGIENARLLLASTATHPQGVGNANDQVGRCFLGHVTFGVLQSPDESISSVCVSDPQPMSLYTDNAPASTHCVLAATLEGQRRFGIGNFTTSLFGPFPRERDDVNAVLDLAGRLDTGPSAEAARNFICYFMSEQLPNLDSRVTLDTANVDALGMPRVQLDWSFTAADLDRLESAIAALAIELGADGKGRVCWPVAREQMLSVLDPARHHIGTTRMDKDPARGVVDADCRVHGMANLYVAGSSVFPTSGIANPTLTIIALAMRLSDTLKRRLRERR
jgi:choline dehydrogenase-like flavoprotein